MQVKRRKWKRDPEAHQGQPTAPPYAPLSSSGTCFPNHQHLSNLTARSALNEKHRSVVAELAKGGSESEKNCNQSSSGTCFPGDKRIKRSNPCGPYSKMRRYLVAEANSETASATENA